jgi:hypothetical protein
MNCPSFYFQSKYGRMTQFLSTQELLKSKKICSQWRKTAHKKQICIQQKFAHRICSQHRKTAHEEKPCRLGWINTMAKCLASSQSEHGWRAPLNGLSHNGWNVLGQTFQVHYPPGSVPRGLQFVAQKYVHNQDSRSLLLGVYSTYPGRKQRTRTYQHTW